jgi:acyl carrier protein
MGTGVPWYEAALIIGVNALPLVIFIVALGAFMTVWRLARQSIFFDMSYAVVVLAVFLFVVLIFAWVFDPSERPLRRFKSELAARESLSDSAMVSQYFSPDFAGHDVPGTVRRIIGEQMGLPADKLLPDDDLSGCYPDLDLIELVRELEEEFELTISDADAEQTPFTVRALTELMINKIGRARPSSPR